MDADRCVSCGDIIPEGRQICWKCEHFYSLSSVSKYHNIRPVSVIKYIIHKNTQRFKFNYERY